MNTPDSTPTHREDLTGLLSDLERLEEIFASWDDASRHSVEAYRRAIDALHGEALRRLIRALRAEPAALTALKEAVADEVVYAVLRHHALIRPSLNERIEAALAAVRPTLATHGGDVHLVEVAPPVAEVQLTGACDGCSASALTFHAGVKKAVQDACPEITEVVLRTSSKATGEQVRFVSPFASEDDAWLQICTLHDVAENAVHAMEVGTHKIVLWRRGTMVTCFENACAHLGRPMHDGKVEREMIVCPHHGFRYDLTSGACLTAPEVQLQPHAVRVVNGRIEVRFAS